MAKRVHTENIKGYTRNLLSARPGIPACRCRNEGSWSKLASELIYHRFHRTHTATQQYQWQVAQLCSSPKVSRLTFTAGEEERHKQLPQHGVHYTFMLYLTLQQLGLVFTAQRFKGQSCGPIYTSGANLTAFYFFCCCCHCSGFSQLHMLSMKGGRYSFQLGPALFQQ